MLRRTNLTHLHRALVTSSEAGNAKIVSRRRVGSEGRLNRLEHQLARRLAPRNAGRSTKSMLFSDQYARALDARTDAMAEEILEIADDDSEDAVTDPETGATRLNAEFVARSRIRVDTRKWLMARMAPKKYGDKVQQEVSGPNGGALTTITRIELVAAPFKAQGEG
jgi:hypothetical protein